MKKRSAPWDFTVLIVAVRLSYGTVMLLTGNSSLAVMPVSVVAVRILRPMPLQKRASCRAFIRSNIATRLIIIRPLRATFVSSDTVDEAGCKGNAVDSWATWQQGMSLGRLSTELRINFEVGE